jgi:hypothetical protein
MVRVKEALLAIHDLRVRVLALNQHDAAEEIGAQILDRLLFA